jgi:hypothetical protein
MKHNIQIIARVNDVNYNLETFDVEAMPITYQISDINDFKNNKSTFSKTIILPLTDNNKKVLGFISNLYNTANLFSPIRKTPVWITRDNILIFEGVMEYNEVDLTEDSFSIVVYEDNYQLWSLIGDKYLTDLDYSRFDHTISSFDYASVTQSWAADYNNGYYYGFVDWYDTTTQNTANPEYTYKDFKPLWYLKPLVYQIFAENGYAINSTFFNSQYFENLLVGDGNLAKYLGAMKVQLPVGSTASSSLVSENTSCPNFPSTPQIPGTDVPTFMRSYSGNISADTTIVDAFGEYNTLTYIYTAADPATKTFMIDYNLDYGDNINMIFDAPFRSISNPLAIQNFTGLTQSLFAINIILTCRKITPSGYITYGGSPVGNVITSGSKTPLTGGFATFSVTNNFHFPNRTATGTCSGTYTYETWNIKGTAQFDFDDYINIGDTVQFEFRIDYASPTGRWGNGSTATFPNTDNVFSPIWDQHAFITAVGPNTITKIYPSNSTDPTGNINASKSLPKNIKQTDFLNTVFKTFNLYIEPSKDFNNTFNIEPRDIYYSQVQKVNDWSNKVDLSQSIISSILSNEQKKINTFTYKQDKDYWNTSYTNNTQRTYGDYIYKLDNYYLDGENKIELIFSPSPMREFLPTSTTGRIFAPQIIQVGLNGEISPYNGCNIRLLTRNTTNPTSQLYFDGVIYSTYPYVGHTDNPLAPNYDINFAPVSEFYSSEYSITPNNLYNTFWTNTMDALSNPQAKLLSIYIYLTPTDIKEFRFNDLIYLEALGGATNYWRVNKIANYDPLTDLPTLVELVEAFDYTLPGVNTIDIDNITGGGQGTGVGPGFTDGLPPDTNFVVTSQDFTNINGNKIAVSGALVNGKGNNLSPGSRIGTPFITGDNNSIVSSTSITLGNNNVTYGEGLYIIGDNNQIGTQTASVNNIFNIGSNNTITTDTSNTVVIGNNISNIVSGSVYINSDQIFIGSSQSNIVIVGTQDKDGLIIFSFTASTDLSNSYQVFYDVITLETGQTARVKTKALAKITGYDGFYSEGTAVYTYDGSMYVAKSINNLGDVTWSPLTDLTYSADTIQLQLQTSAGVDTLWTVDIEYRIA